MHIIYSHVFAVHLNIKIILTPKQRTKSNLFSLSANFSSEIEEEDAFIVGFKLPVSHKVLFKRRILDEWLATVAAESVKM